MRIAVIGGGPAGLSLAYLLRSRHPSCDVVMFERSSPEAQLGFGLTLPLATLHLVDRALEVPITRVIGPPRAIYQEHLFVPPVREDIETIDRSDLLRLLRARSAELGVRHAPARDQDAAALLASHDLVVAADGAHSSTRRALTAELGATVELGTSRFAWLGTAHAFEHLTMLVEETPEGPFLAWGYRYAAGRSTFIVECGEATWTRARLDRQTPDEACRYLATVFARHLEGNSLHGGTAASWQQFPTVRMRSWSHGNLVFIGDAAHTSHYSVGSGTTEAIRDAVCLADAIGETGPGPDALAAFHARRQADVTRLQERATRWMRRCEAILRDAEAGHRDRVVRQLAHCVGLT